MTGLPSRRFELEEENYQLFSPNLLRVISPRNFIASKEACAVTGALSDWDLMLSGKVELSPEGKVVI